MMFSTHSMIEDTPLMDRWDIITATTTTAATTTTTTTELEPIEAGNLIEYQEADLVVGDLEEEAELPKPSETVSSNFQVFLENPESNQIPSENDANAIVAEQLTRLTPTDLEHINDGIHGVADVIPEPACFVEQKLTELEQELSKIQDKPAYDMAYKANPEYVSDKDFRLSFLRADRFDAPLAALRLTRHFHAKIEFFGKNCLGRDVSQEDLSAEDREGLYSGLMQRLPQRDRSGRAVFLSFAHPKHATMKARSKMKWGFYLYYTALKDDVESQRNGIVVILYQVGHNHFLETSDDLAPVKDAVEAMIKDCAKNAKDDAENIHHNVKARNKEMKRSFWNSAQLPHTLPLRCEAIHICYDSKVWKPMIAILKFAMSNILRLRIRTHFGSHQECLYNLMTFGVPTSAFPIRHRNRVDDSLTGPASDVTILIERHVQSMLSYRDSEKEQAKEALGGFWKKDQFISLPNPQDVLFGKGRGIMKHPGNLNFQQLVRGQMERYEQANKTEKTQMAFDLKRVVEESLGGRFLKSNQDCGWVEETDETEIRKKIASSFRAVRKEKKASQRKATKNSAKNNSNNNNDANMNDYNYGGCHRNNIRPPTNREDVALRQGFNGFDSNQNYSMTGLGGTMAQWNQNNPQDFATHQNLNQDTSCVDQQMCYFGGAQEPQPFLNF